MKRVHGADSIAAFDLRNNIAHARADAGDLDTAIAELEHLAADQSNAHGAAHPETLTTRGNLARWLHRPATCGAQRSNWNKSSTT
ncbi:tetratricopeptide repeat protein [Lentzea pudingi]|uniref:tetratricopeptide repeat protein n=1 Tax=Lentzea pudingi TaxID=1789439 RepID=UPI0035712A67